MKNFLKNIKIFKNNLNKYLKKYLKNINLKKIYFLKI